MSLQPGPLGLHLGQADPAAIVYEVAPTTS
jgi:hypothetical protein